MIGSKGVVEGNHWRKSWPEGVVDDGNDDGEEEVLSLWSNRRRVADNAPPEDPAYPWSYDEDVFNTHGSIKAGEKLVKDSLTFDSVKAWRGRDMFFTDAPKDGDRLTTVPGARIRF